MRESRSGGFVLTFRKKTRSHSSHKSLGHHGDSRKRHYALAGVLAMCLGACHGGGQPSDAASDNALTALPSALPMSTSAPGATTLAPSAATLPVGRPLRLGRFARPDQGYAYLNRAYYQQGAVGNAPPDYAFDAGGVRPWTWATGNRGRVISEPVPGGYRYYYYNPGENTPYMVRDPQYAYAYNGGMLVAVYTLAGALVNVAPDSQPALYGSRYYDRGRSLWQGAVSGHHEPVNAYTWGDRQADLAARHAAWQRQMASNAEWAAWNAANQANEQAEWQNVRVQHEQAAQQFGAWQQRHFQGVAPQFYAPPPAAGPAPVARPQEQQPQGQRPQEQRPQEQRPQEQRLTPPPGQYAPPPPNGEAPPAARPGTVPVPHPEGHPPALRLEAHPEAHPAPHPEAHPIPRPEAPHPEARPASHPEVHPVPHPEAHPAPHPEVHPAPHHPAPDHAKPHEHEEERPK